MTDSDTTVWMFSFSSGCIIADCVAGVETSCDGVTLEGESKSSPPNEDRTLRTKVLGVKWLGVCGGIALARISRVFSPAIPMASSSSRSACTKIPSPSYSSSSSENGAKLNRALRPEGVATAFLEGVEDSLSVVGVIETRRP